MVTAGKPTAITPAMSTWCRALVDLSQCRLVRRTVPEAPAWKQYRIEGMRCAKPTWAMVDKLMAAGLIQWVEREPHVHVAVLTEAGRKEGTREVAAVSVRAARTEWPFPCSTRYGTRVTGAQHA